VNRSGQNSITSALLNRDIICGDGDVADSWFLQIFFIARIVMIFHYNKVQGSLTAHFHAYLISVGRDNLSCLSFPAYYSKQFLIFPSLSLTCAREENQGRADLISPSLSPPIFFNLINYLPLVSLSVLRSVIFVCS